MNKKRIGVIFGGESDEYSVSLQSATAVIRNINTEKYIPVYIGITRQGQWKIFEGDIEDIQRDEWQEKSRDIDFSDLHEIIDFALPIVHGPNCEDGKLQGLMETLNIPYGGCGVLASALAMDKASAKRIFQQVGLPVGKYYLVSNISDIMDIDFQQIEKEVGYPAFIKPANLGSSVGISKAQNREELIEAVKKALKYDTRVLVEEYINCREVETAIMGNEVAEVASLGEIVPKATFYDFDAKYSDDSGTEIIIPAKVTEDEARKIKEMAVVAYEALDCQGFARVDFFIDKDKERILINEINTIPGFTKYSMFPMLWQAVGLKYTEIIERIIELGYERYNFKNYRKTKI